MVEMLGSVGHGIEQITRRHLVRQLRRRGVKILTRSTVTAIGDHRVDYITEDGSAGELAADLVALAVGWRPRGERLAAPLIDSRRLIVIGDASRPADFVAAIAAGAAAGRAV
jgi:NADPH-dependent 2,4-dienoyl-CoA reductase/sulfur reductase-like enzyme